MAKKVIVELIDDLDGTAITEDGGETIRFSLDNIDYSIDLSTANANNLRNHLQQYIDHAEKVALSADRRGKRAPVNAEIKIIRDWARNNGYTVSNRGRVPAPIIAAYRAAH